MNHSQRFITALERGIPDHVPTFELEYQIEEEMFGQKFDYSKATYKALEAASPKERDHVIHSLAEYMVDLFVEKMDYDSIPVNGPHVPMWNRADQTHTLNMIRALREIVGDTVCIHTHGDGTYGIPNGTDMYEFAYRLVDEPEEVLADAQFMADRAIGQNRELREAGIDVFILCTDYCYNSGPYISPKKFSEIVTPYLAQIIAAIRADGAYAIKHTDGNIMPIIDQLVEANPHALHSLDPMAGVDIKTVKEKWGDRVALCGNVNCALMQTGTDAEVEESAMYCLTHGKPGGGYIFCTSNIPFKGMPAERYRMILDIWKKHRDY